MMLFYLQFFPECSLICSWWFALFLATEMISTAPSRRSAACRIPSRPRSGALVLCCPPSSFSCLCCYWPLHFPSGGERADHFPAAKAEKRRTNDSHADERQVGRRAVDHQRASGVWDKKKKPNSLNLSF